MTPLGGRKGLFTISMCLMIFSLLLFFCRMSLSCSHTPLLYRDAINVKKK